MTPPPMIEQRKAREAVMTVIGVFADRHGDRETGWDRWEEAFTGDDQQGLEEVWARAGGTEGVEQEIRSLSASRVGRQWKDGNEGEVVLVELEYVVFCLRDTECY